MFRTVNQDNSTSEVTIAGARSHASNNQDIATLVFKNYDADTSNSYRLATISARDAFGTTDSNGFGNLVFSTNQTGTLSNTLHDRLVITHQGYVGINTLTPQYHLDVNGNINIACNLTAPIITTLSNYTYSLGSAPTYASNAAGYASNTVTILQEQANYSSNSITNLQTLSTFNSNTAVYASNYITSIQSQTATPIINPISITTTDYIQAYSWISESNATQPASLIVNSYLVENSNAEITSSNFAYALRLYDSTNNAYLGQLTLSNNTQATNTIAISNFTTTRRSIIELHAKKQTALGNYVRITGLLLKY
ncbi:hypothetical protein EBT25_18495 [bacterium]|nr:hypothetical protein [bacterium]